MSEYQQSSEMSTGWLLFWLVFELFWTRQLTQYLWEARAVSWLLLGGGFFITIVVFSEVASNTQPGQYISGWWWRIGKVGHLLIILLLFAVFLWMIVFLATRGSLFLLESFLLGMGLGVIVWASMILVRRGIQQLMS